MEGCRVRGPFALGEGSQLRMGTLVYGPTTVGQGCKVGGELSNVVIHDFQQGPRRIPGQRGVGIVVQPGCRNHLQQLENTYGEIAEWSDQGRAVRETGTFCGLLMGDHSKSASTLHSTRPP